MSVSPSRFVVYSRIMTDKPRSGSPKKSGAILRQHVNGLSYKAAMRMRQAIEALVYTSVIRKVYYKMEHRYFDFKVNFITLTLPSVQCHSDSVIVNKILSPFLMRWKKEQPSLLYVWKAEVQDNGNIHFHITSNMFYHHRLLLTHWLKYVDRLGYVARSGLERPNATDVHAIHKVNNIAAYLTSYVTKKDLYKKVLKRYHRRYGKVLRSDKSPFFTLPKNYFSFIKRKLSCVLWSCSKELKKPTLNIACQDPIFKKEVNHLASLTDFWIQKDYCRIMYTDYDVLDSLNSIGAAYKSSIAPLLALQNSAPVIFNVRSIQSAK